MKIQTSATARLKGGPGSGHHGHRGRPGKVGGSLPDDASTESTPSAEEFFVEEAPLPFTKYHEGSWGDTSYMRYQSDAFRTWITDSEGMPDQEHCRVVGPDGVVIKDYTSNKHDTIEIRELYNDGKLEGNWFIHNHPGVLSELGDGGPVTLSIGDVMSALNYKMRGIEAITNDHYAYIEFSDTEAIQGMHLFDALEMKNFIYEILREKQNEVRHENIDYVKRTAVAGEASDPVLERKLSIDAMSRMWKDVARRYGFTYKTGKLKETEKKQITVIKGGPGSGHHGHGGLDDVWGGSTPGKGGPIDSRFLDIVGEDSEEAVVYHTTKSKNVESILSEGISKSGKGVYFTTSEESSESDAMRFEDSAVLTLKIPSKNYGDVTFDEYDFETYGREDAFYISAEIPSDWIIDVKKYSDWGEYVVEKGGPGSGYHDHPGLEGVWGGSRSEGDSDKKKKKVSKPKSKPKKELKEEAENVVKALDDDDRMRKIAVGLGADGTFPDVMNITYSMDDSSAVGKKWTDPDSEESFTMNWENSDVSDILEKLNDDIQKAKDMKGWNIFESSKEERKQWELEHYGRNFEDNEHAELWALVELEKFFEKVTGKESDIVEELEERLEDVYEEKQISTIIVIKGGPGSGHHGHRGRPGEVGGSLPDDAPVRTPPESAVDRMEETVSYERLRTIRDRGLITREEYLEKLYELEGDEVSEAIAKAEAEIAKAEAEIEDYFVGYESEKVDFTGIGEDIENTLTGESTLGAHYMLKDEDSQQLRDDLKEVFEFDVTDPEQTSQFLDDLKAIANLENIGAGEVDIRISGREYSGADHPRFEIRFEWFEESENFGYKGEMGSGYLSVLSDESGKYIIWDTLDFEPEYQNKDAVTSVYGKAIDTFANKWKMDRIETDAAMTIGRYAWAKKGFDYAQDSGLPTAKRRLVNWMMDRNLDSEIYDLNKRLPEFKSAYDIATYDPGITIKGSQIQNDAVPEDMDLHIGKAFMLDFNGHGSWNAEFDLKRFRQ